MPDFQVLPHSPALTAGLVLRVGSAPHRYLRLTHVFRTCAYGMWVGDPEAARYARRPHAIPLRDLKALAASPSAAWGRLVLPPALSTEPEKDSDKAALLDSAWGLVQALVQAFQSESNLSRQSFSALVRQRAEETESSPSTVLRTLLRYYYFGGTRLALLPLPPGVKPGQVAYADDTETGRPPPRRRGRQSSLARELGRNEFIVRSEDIQDMVDCFKRLLAKGPTFKTIAHEDYLAKEFRARHRALYDKYVAREIPEPVTARQFRNYLDEHLRVTEELARNVRTHTRNPGFTGNVRAAGPGEIYEIDATGGRLHLVSSDDPPVLLGKPTIYLLIDRWSRFVVSAYISLRPASYEEVRHALLVAFTSREARFNRLGINVTDERWPVGRMPAVICPDRGSDFMSESMEQSVVNDLRIDLTPLPPLCPDGKAIVERLIREIKRRMAASGIEGVFADRPMDPRTKRATRKAAAAAVRTLSEAYRLLVDIVVDHNNRPHSTLRRRRVLTQAGVQPTPREAYLWGLRHITGLRSAPLSENDYHRLLLSTDKASIANGVLSYKSRPYLPDNEPAAGLARHSTRRPRRVDVRLDKTLPTQIFVPNVHGNWARFQMSGGVANEIAGVSLDEEEAMADHTALLWARADHQGRVARVAAKTAKHTSPGKTAAEGAVSNLGKAVKGKPAAAQLPRAELIAARNKETARMKAALHGKSSNASTDADPPQASTPDWMRVEEEERQRNLALIRKHRSRR
ncbi:transposase family protein [Hydrogenophaga intermedia]|uniref:transposase family protein n=1 Tax=Hydrogenophaga intermedia TaxID=65786 RepID=UPI002043000E|nr:transposase family protein [Hydrogenophaga intermedia]MCM3564764.1 transposase family protein [Hydrogenophaga intermedia]